MLPRDTSEREATQRTTSVAALRTERGWLEDTFCPRCDCMKSGWADVPNVGSDWCEDVDCPCHIDDETET
jgi:hypothetical protein